MSRAAVVFQPEGRRSPATVGRSIFEVAKDAGVLIQSICGGLGVCGKCRVIVRSGSKFLSEPSSSEAKFISMEDLGKGFRLACSTYILQEGEVIIEIPAESLLSWQRLLVEGVETFVKPAPVISKLVVHVDKPSLNDVRPDLERLLDALRREHKVRVDKVGYEAMKKLPSSLRIGGWKVTLVLRDGGEVIWIEPREALNELYGFAVDLGTTKLAGYLTDLRTGKVLATSSMMNPQIPYGEDIISRISYASRSPKNLKELHKVVIEAFNKLIAEACKKAGVGSFKLYEVVIVGNTAMHHIFLNINPKYVALAPYPTALKTSMDLKAKDLRVKVNPGAYIHTLPLIAGFVGSDAVADILATEIYKSDFLAMVIDLGTNTEVILGYKDRLLACSCASGPAFEGARIKFGMRAASGAIEKVKIHPEKFEVSYETIGGDKPRGLCGSAVIDAMAGMLKAGIIDRGGRIKTDLNIPRVKVRGQQPEFIIAWKDETSIGEDITVTQRDIREIQLAKAAVYTGASILMKHMGVKAEDIQQISIAGAFGTYIDPESASLIGMYPDIPINKVRFVGNAAGSGAKMALISKDIRRLADEVSRKVEYVELGADPSFNQEFMKAIHLPHMEINRFPHVKKTLTIS